MKTAVFIEDGVTQLILTPETELEQKVVSTVKDGHREAAVYTGDFYKCQGGWTRMDGNYPSLIVVIKKAR